MQQKHDAAQAMGKQREQDLVAQLSAQAEARQWPRRRSGRRVREKSAPPSNFQVLLVSHEKERDEANQSASRATPHAEPGEKIDGSVLVFNGWKMQKH